MSLSPLSLWERARVRVFKRGVFFKKALRQAVE
jgi:hypothetical protein